MNNIRGCGCATMMNFGWNSSGPIVQTFRCEAHGGEKLAPQVETGIDRSF